MMDMNNYRGESHVAQQSRRDKLRVQHQSEHLEDHNNYSNLEQQYQDHYQLRNVKYGSTTPYDNNGNVFSSSDMMSYVVKKNWNHVLLPQNEQCLVSVDDKFSVANCGNNWKSVGTQHGYDWVVNANGVRENNYSNNALFMEGGIKGNNTNTFYMKQQGSGYNGYSQDVVESSVVGNMSGETSLIHQNGIRNFGNNGSSSQFDYQNTLQGVVTNATVGGEGHHDVVGRYGGKDSNELLLLSSFGNASGNWVNRPIEEFRGVRDRRMIGDSTCNAQGLSLSLSSVPICSSTREGQFGGRNYSSDVLDTKGLMSSRNSIGSNFKGFGNSTHIPQRSGVGPLGPFTGYATILKNSKFLKPTLQLLDELCGATCATRIDQSNEMYSDKMTDDQEVVGVSCDRVGVNAGESMVIGTPRGGDQSGVSSSAFYSSNEISGEGGGRSSSNECYRPENHQKKAKLLYMQEEVCRRYKQYHQQMQMVVSSFESVAGLSAATPYISMALKTVSRHFRCLKHAITDQLRHMGKALGEDLSSPTAGTSSSSKGDTNTTRLKYTDYGFQKHKSGGSNQLVLFEPQPPVWRPQRGLPERAVAVLRAWLFDHFLHPYPTDTDKHVLATQTGLTRNQVSNWFINARVRVWKPMVEEIHVLETKGSTEPSSQTGNVNENPSSDQNANHEYDNQPTSKLLATGFDPSRSRDAPNAEHWNQEKRSRVECQIPSANIDGSLMSFLPYQRGGLEIGAGLGAVSLTLGLRQSAETAQQQQQQLQQQDHFRQTFGGQIVHDFVG